MFFAALLLSLAAPPVPDTPSPSKEDQTLQRAGGATSAISPVEGAPMPDRELFSRLRSLLEGTGYSAEIHYRAVHCRDILNRASVEARVQRLAEQDILPSVRELFRGWKDVTIYRSSPRIISINMAKMSGNIDPVRLALVRFEGLQQYEPDLALGKVEGAAEFQATERKHGLTSTFPVIYSYLGSPNQQDPHLPAASHNVTVGQVLEMIMNTFGGVVIYQECPSSHQFALSYIGSGGHLRSVEQ